ncbi:MAG TPA: beta-propeller domain-containing protein [Clostridia bacterium]|nr:beta-propeller domain-containing protein [Clostridia bacterium]
MKRNLNQVVPGLASALVLVALFCCSAAAQTLKPQPIRTYSKLLKLLKEHQPAPSGPVMTNFVQPPRGQMQVIFQPTALGLTSVAQGSSLVQVAAQVPRHSQTLVQVAGVDEADEVVNDGTHIYQVNQGRVLIIRAYPAKNLSVEASLDFSNTDFFPQGLYLDNGVLVVVGSGAREPIPRRVWRKWEQYFPFLLNNTVQVKAYDITDPQRPRKVREVEIDGDYVGSRKIGSTLYLISRHYPHCYGMNFKTSAALRLATPGFRDTRRGVGFQALSPLHCYYLPDFEDPNYLVVAAVHLEPGPSTTKISAYLGAGEQVYASTENLYITASRPFSFWRSPISTPIFTTIPTPLVTVFATNESPGIISWPGQPFIPVLPPIPMPPAPTFEPTTDETDIYKISLTGGRPAFRAARRVPGTILNSYSMDENNGFLRVATTVQSWSGGGQQTNNVYVLDSDLHLAGKLEGIAPGERIYAARFLNQRLFLVTFRQIDPLFAIDLSDPSNPVVSGELVLPGFSNFLLPYDQNHLIGLGKEAVGPSEEGLKLSLFDVSDLRNPMLVNSVIIGDLDTDSPALHDPHALLFDPERKLLAFPASVTKLVNPDPTDSSRWAFSRFQGAYVFKVDPANGFELRGTVTHMPDVNTPWGYPDYEINRVLTIGSDLFTLSSALVQANDCRTLTPKFHLELAP